MRIGIDASRYKINEPTGVEWYSYHLLNHLIPLLGRIHDHEVVIFANESFKNGKVKFPVELPFNVRLEIVEREKHWTQIGLLKALKKERIDLLFVPSHIAPLLYGGKLVTTIHDIAFRIPELKKSYGFKERMFLSLTTAWMVLRAKKVIVPSEATAEDVEKYYGGKNKLRVIYHGGPERSGENNPLLLKWKTAEENELNKKFVIDKSNQMMLFVGRIELKKNLLRVVDAFAKFHQKHNNWKLVLAGKDGFGANLIKDKVTELGLLGKVIFSGYIKEREKQYLLSRADFLVFPSLYEGFGLPILEAFAFRKPVLTSAVSSMPEVAGEAAYLVNADSTEEIYQGMIKLAENESYRKKLAEKMEKQLEKFDWQKSAEQTLEVLMESLK
ncbi:MAG: glycosyltransferase family 4 protein [Candidatus Altimarinota bacterium]